MAIKIVKKKACGGGEELEYQHESYGLVGFSRVQCNPPAEMFGSSIKHSNYITLKISRAHMNRHLHKDWPSSGGNGPPIVEVSMSYTQFAEAMTNMGVGDGVPCTIDRVDGIAMERCETISKRAEFSHEFKKSMHGIGSKADDTIEKIQEQLKKGKAGKGDLEEILRSVQMLKQHITSDIPFVEQQFNKQVDQTVMEAKGEIDAHITHVVQATGLKAIKNGDYDLAGVIEHTEDKEED